jgi:hypothetical protein
MKNIFNKRGQLGWIEFKYFMAGFFIGMIVLAILVVLGNNGILPFQIPICPSCAVK